MSDDHLIFSERYGYRDLPDAMKPEELSHDLRREIWNTVRAALVKEREFGGYSYYFPEAPARFLERVLGRLLRLPEDEIDTSYDEVMSLIKKMLVDASFNTVLDLSEHIVNDPWIGRHLVAGIGSLFDRYGAPYAIDTSRAPYWFSPRASIAQGDAVQRAIGEIRDSNMSGADAHLRDAARHINAKQYADSIADSIHAVVSVAKAIDPEGSRTLGPALASLERSNLLKHPSLAKAFKTLYGYTCEEQGIRHPLVTETAANVGIDEAVFMYGACASFAAYLTAKHRQIDNEENPA